MEVGGSDWTAWEKGRKEVSARVRDGKYESSKTRKDEGKQTGGWKEQWGGETRQEARTGGSNELEKARKTEL